MNEREIKNCRKGIVNKYKLSERTGDLVRLSGRLYVTHCGLLRIAQLEQCGGITVSCLVELSIPRRCEWFFKASVTNSSGGLFEGYGDANPSNVPLQMHGAEMRIAETRAVNRALRKAYGIGQCSLEELGSNPTGKPLQQVVGAKIIDQLQVPRPFLRDQISFLIRKYKLDSELVKRYAAHFCGTKILRNASRELIEGFATELAHRAEDDLSGLQRSLREFSCVEEVAS